MPTCAVCATENPEEARFCLACGEPIVCEASPQRELRKTVTVLFCDVADYTAAALAEVLQAAGRFDDAADAARRAADRFEQKGSLVDAERARALVEQLAAEPLAERD